jgi:hypothetical protein
MTAYVYPLLDILWTLLLVAITVVVIFLIVYALIDNFSRRDHGGLVKGRLVHPDHNSSADWHVAIYYITSAGES